MRGLARAETLIPFLIVFGAALLIASEFMTIFELAPPGGEVQQVLTGSERHSFSLVILAVFAVIAMIAAIATGLRPYAFVVAGLGIAALVLFLVIDLPKAGQEGTLPDFFTARADPKAGFWLEAIGAVVLAIAGGIFASFRSDQLRTHARRVERSGGRRRTGGERTESSEGSKSA